MKVNSDIELPSISNQHLVYDQVLVHHDASAGVNQQWHVQAWSDTGGLLDVYITWGRVGGIQRRIRKCADRTWVERAIRQKQQIGYLVIPTQHTKIVPVVASSATREVIALHATLLKESNHALDAYLDIPIHAITPDHLAAAYNLLCTIQPLALQWQHQATVALYRTLFTLTEQFYTAVPTTMSRSVSSSPKRLVDSLCRPDALASHAEKLLQLDVEVRQNLVSSQSHNIPYALGAHVQEIDANSSMYERICSWIASTSIHGYRIEPQHVFEVHLAAERQRYRTNTRGTSYRMMLFHGAHSALMRSILTRGLICPLAAQNGRMFGNGMYFADVSSKAANYCDALLDATPLILLLCEVAIGTSYVAPYAQHFSHAPTEYDSVAGIAGQTLGLQCNEYVVYEQAQQTIRYLITFDIAS